MTREEQILEYANSFKGKGMESEELKEIIHLAIIDGAKWADNHPIKPSLPSNLDEAAEEYVKTTSVKVWGRINPEKDFEGYMACASYGTGLLDGFKAGAKWMARQGETHEQYVIREIAGHDIGPAIVSYPDTFEIGDKVIVQIRKEY